MSCCLLSNSSHKHVKKGFDISAINSNCRSLVLHSRVYENMPIYAVNSAQHSITTLALNSSNKALVATEGILGQKSKPSTRRLFNLTPKGVKCPKRLFKHPFEPYFFLSFAYLPKMRRAKAPCKQLNSEAIRGATLCYMSPVIAGKCSIISAKCVWNVKKKDLQKAWTTICKKRDSCDKAISG